MIASDTPSDDTGTRQTAAHPERQKVTAEGHSLAEALENAARELGVDVALVDHELDREWFRTPEGGRTGRDTVRILAWARDPGETAGAVAARAWVEELIEKMGLKARVRAVVDEPKVAELRVDSPDARHLVGRRGITLHAIEDLLQAAMAGSYPDWTFHLEVAGGERKDERRGDRHEGRREGGRSEGRRERRRDGDDRRRDRRDRSEGRRERGHDRLRKLARRVAEEVLEKGEPVEIRKQLNSFERRVVHLAVAEVEGVTSESVGEGPYKQVVISPAAAPAAEAPAEDA